MEVTLTPLKNKKNLLAFSAGVDSTALFFLLMQEEITFDLAIVDYNIRKESKQEIAYAQALAKKYNKQLFVKDVPPITNNFEHRARGIRYDFFETVINRHGYENLVTAHQLDDMFEWFMMQLSKGAGVNELLGFELIKQKEGYNIVKPLLYTTKEQLLAFLDSHGYRYFIDASNNDETFKRNYFRKRFTKEFLQEFHSGVAKSFLYLQQDKALLDKHYKLLYEKEYLRVYRCEKQMRQNLTAKVLKEFGYVMSGAQRKQISSSSVVIGGKYAVGSCEDLLFICKQCSYVMSKKQKELCRIAKVPKHCRPYICKIDADLELIKRLGAKNTI